MTVAIEQSTDLGIALVLTDEQPSLIAAQAGFRSFPGARAQSLDAAGWKAVERGLVARDVLRPDAGPDDWSGALALLGFVLHADAMPWLRIIPADGEGHDEVLLTLVS